MILRGKHYLLDGVYDFHCEDGMIREIRAPSGATPDLGGDEYCVLPGLIDLQVNGYAGIDFCSPEVQPADVERASLELANAGTTSYLPTVITNSVAAIEASLRAIAAACAAGGAAQARIRGIHLEGPYISPLDGPRGTHPREYVRSPDWDEFCRWQQAAGGRIRLVTLAPEIPGALEFIAHARAAGIVVALGHHAGTLAEINAAVAAGASLSTHLGNGAHAQLPRHPNYIWEQLANDALQASIIVDGHHLPPSVVKAFYRVKGPERLILVSDTVWLADMPPGRYSFAGQDVDLCDDRSVRLSGSAYLAGSIVKMIDSVNNVLAFTGAPLADAVRMAAINPAQLIGATDRGRLATAARADLLLVRGRPDTTGFALSATLVAGKVAFLGEA